MGEAVLMPCPFCAVADVEQISTPAGKGERIHWCYCRGCGASGPPANSEPLSVSAWNMRKMEPRRRQG